MIKRKLILFAMLLYGAVMHSQTTIWEENFDPPPPDWNLDENWVFQEEVLMFRWYPPSSNYDIAAISPLISLPEEATELSIFQFLGVNSVLVTNEQAQISIISGNTEIEVWNHLCSSGNWGYEGGQELIIPVSDYAGQDIQIKFRSFGSSTDIWNYWFVYKMNIKALFNSDLQVTEVQGDNNIAIGENGNWSVFVKNTGVTDIENFNLHLFCNKTAQILTTVNYSEVIEAGNTAEIEMQWASENSYNTTIVGIINNDFDDFAGNNQSQPYFLRIEPDESYNVLVLDMDNGIASIENPETHVLEQANEGIENALFAAGIAYDYDDRIPSNISDYEIVILTLGSFCLG